MQYIQFLFLIFIGNPFFLSQKLLTIATDLNIGGTTVTLLTAPSPPPRHPIMMCIPKCQTKKKKIHEVLEYHPDTLLLERLTPLLPLTPNISVFLNDKEKKTSMKYLYHPGTLLLERLLPSPTDTQHECIPK